MRKLIGITGVLVTLSTLLLGAADWQLASEGEGILTYSKKVEGSDLVAFRGETVIEAPLAKVAGILIDTSRKKEWVYRLEEAKDIRDIGPFERVEYNHTASGFFFIRDRDFVFRAKAELDRAKKRMTINLESVEDERMPEAGPVRGHIDNSRYILTELAPGKTHLVVEIHADPKGNVPSWLVNTFQKAWPRKTLEGIRQQASRKDVAEHPATKAYFADRNDTQVASDGRTPSISHQ